MGKFFGMNLGSSPWRGGDLNEFYGHPFETLETFLGLCCLVTCLSHDSVHLLDARRKSLNRIHMILLLLQPTHHHHSHQPIKNPPHYQHPSTMDRILSSLRTQCEFSP